MLNMTEEQQKEGVGTARMTGIWYLLLAITGIVGFMLLHSRIYVTDDPAQTLTNLTEQETLARLRLVFECLIVLSQVLAALWFYKLFKDIHHVAAWSIAIWGTVNAIAIMISAIPVVGRSYVNHPLRVWTLIRDSNSLASPIQQNSVKLYNVQALC